jgi:tellurite resistance protein
MSRAPIFPTAPIAPKLKAFQRMPPAVFPAIMGLFGLGLALRRAAETFGATGGAAAGLAEAILGATTLLWAFASLGYGVKLMRRPGVIWEDLSVLPGRAGLAAMTLGVFLVAAVLLPYAPVLARTVMVAGFALHAGLALLVLLAFARGPAELRQVTPVWHLHFVGFIIAGLAAAPLGMITLAQGLVWGMGAIALVIWGVSLWQFIRRIPPAPLRPLLAIHLAPVSLLGTVAALSGLGAVAQAMALFGVALLLALVLSARWMLQSGFSPLWGALTFPLAAYASLCLSLGGVWGYLGLGLVLIGLGMIPAIAVKVIQLWVRGTLAAKTNAATA